MPSELIRALRERINEDGLRATARSIGVSHSTLYKILEGRDFQDRTLIKIANYLRISPAEAFRMAHDEPKAQPNDAIYDALQLIASMMSLLPDDVVARIIEHFTHIIRTEMKFFRKNS